MHNNYYFLKLLATELKLLLVGADLENCFSQEKDEVILEFSSGLFLKCMLNPDFSIIHPLQDYHRAKKNTVSLWSEFYGLKVMNIQCFNYERAIGVYLEKDVVIVVKLFGNRPNLLIYRNSELMYLFNNKLQSDRLLLLNDFDKKPEWIYKAFEKLGGDYRKMFFTFGKEIIEYLQQQLEGQNIQQKWQVILNLIKYLEQPIVYINRTNEIPHISLFKGQETQGAIEAIATFVPLFLGLKYFNRLKQNSIKNLAKEIAKVQNYIEVTTAKLKALQRGLKNEEIGNIIMANLHEIGEGKDEVALFNFYDNTSIKVRLKKDLSPQKNAEVYYRKSKNEKIELETIENNLVVAETKLERLLEKLVSVENAKEMRDLRQIHKVENTKVKDKVEAPFREFVFKGITIWVGKSAKSNDLLLSSYAHKDDWWLHARDVSGSHVIIKKNTITEDVLEYAASLAAYYSKARNEQWVAVTYTQKKYIRKGKNLAPGKVILEREKSILVQPKEK